MILLAIFILPIWLRFLLFIIVMILGIYLVLKIDKPEKEFSDKFLKEIEEKKQFDRENNK